MKKITQIAFGLVLVMGLAAGLMPAEASCTAARAVTSSTNTQTFFYTPGNPFTPTGAFPTTPYGGSTTYYTNGIFWSFGGGNPAYGIGNDSGYFKGYSYIIAYFNGISTWLGGGYYGGFPTFLGGPYGSWQIPGIDGCISADGADPGAPDAAECNVVLLTDEANSTGYFAVLSTGANPGGDFEYTANTGFPGAVTLAPIPKPIVLSSTTVGNAINITADVQPGALMPQNGFYLNCEQGEILQGYRIYVRTIPGHDNANKPVQVDTRAINQVFGPPIAPWVPVTPITPIGQPSQFTLDCSAEGDVDYYLCATLTFGGTVGAPYELKNCSMNATKVECGPNLADPQAPEFRRIERGSRDNADRQRGRRSR